jgi:hypothetical protein
MHPPLRTQEYALIHLLMHTFIPMTKDASSLAVEVNNKITHSWRRGYPFVIILQTLRNVEGSE